MNHNHCLNCIQKHDTSTYMWCESSQMMIAQLGCCKYHQNSPEYVAPEVEEVVVDISHLSYDGC